MQDSPGAGEAAIIWSFPEDISYDLSYFCVSVKKEGDDRVIYSNNVAPFSRNDTIESLQSSTKYVVTVAAHYKDGIVKERTTEYDNLGKLVLLQCDFGECLLCSFHFCVVHKIEGEKRFC